MPDNLVLVTAHKEDYLQSAVAAALYFKDSTTLYGRYWGCTESADSLHFESCYYQGIEYAIEHQLQRFDSGAQGEHKIPRGFTPVFTCSFHKLQHSGFHQAVKAFCQEEQPHIASYCQDARTLLPYKASVVLPPDNALLNPT